MNSDKIISLLKELNQDQILIRYKAATKQEQFLFNEQISNFEKKYTGGLREYVNRARLLLDQSEKGLTDLSEYTPSVPIGCNLTVGNDKFFELEKIGFEQLKDVCFVLLAGGEGERLGYPNIKISIETELLTKRKFMELYVSYLKAYEKKLKKMYSLNDDFFIPLCIMVSPSSNEKTKKLFKDFNNFGLKENQVIYVCQDNCPCFLDKDCHLSLLKDRLLLEGKCHGHGDIHSLLYKDKIAENWLKSGKKYMIIFQDTNALIFNAIPSALGVSKSSGLAVNTICIPRKPGESLGAICSLKKEDGSIITVNVEYNQLNPLIKARINPQGDIPNENGLSYFPGNSNVVIFELDTYFKALQENKGLMHEFVNPKYTDETRTTFKSSTRLECLFQEFPKFFKNNEKVGFCVYEKIFCFSTCKNKLSSGIEKLKNNLQPESGFSLEQDIFKNSCFLLNSIGKLKINKLEEDMSVSILGQKIVFGPKILIYPSFACCLSELKEKVKGKISIGNRSTLILKNGSIEKDIYLDGKLVIDSDLKEEIKCENKIRDNYEELKENEGEIYEKIRGYHCITGISN